MTTKLSDMEMTRLCAFAIGYKPKLSDGHVWVYNSWSKRSVSGYAPLINDVQAMALLKTFRLRINQDGEMWSVYKDHGFENPPEHGCSDNLNRAIVECVAQMKRGPPHLVSQDGETCARLRSR